MSSDMTRLDLSFSKREEIGEGGLDLKLTLLSLIDSLCHALAIILSVYMFWDCFRFYDVFAWHSPLFTTAYFLFMTEGFLVFLPHSVLTRGWSQKQVVKFHWVLQMLGFVFICLGMVSVIINKINEGKPHFAKPHSITGLISLVLIILVALFGWWTRLDRKHHFGFKLAHMKLVHAALGVVGYGVGVASQILGYYTHYYKNINSPEWSDFMSVITGLLGGTTFLFALSSLFSRVKKI